MINLLRLNGFYTINFIYLYHKIYKVYKIRLYTIYIRI